MVAAANTALSATADGNQKKPGFPGFIPPGANPQQVAAALAARPAPNVLAGTGLGMGDPMKQIAPIAPAVGGGLAPAFNSGLVGENARYNALPQDNAKNAGRVGAADVPIQASKMGWNDITPLRAPEGARNIYANMGMDDLKQRANLSSDQVPVKAAGMPSAQATPATPPSLNAPWYSPEYARAAGMSDKGGLELERMRAANAPAGLPANDPARRILTTGTASTGPSTAAAAPATPAAATALQNPLRVQEAKLGLSNPGTAPLAAPAGEPQRNASGALTNLGTGTDVGFGVTRYNIPGQSPLFTNKTGDSGAADNMALMNRGAPTAQNAAAMDNLVARSEKQIADGVKMLQYQDQVAAATAFREAQARQEQSRSFAERLNNPRSEESIAINNLQRQLKPNLGESQAAFAARTAAVQAQINAITGAESLSSAERQNSIRYGLERDRLAADQGYNNARLGLDGRRLANEQETGSLTRDQRRMEMDQAKKIQALQDRYLTATGVEQEALGKQLLTMSGKDPKSSMKENFMVVGGGQEWDAQANSMRNVPQTLIDLRTGKPVGGDVGGAKAPTTAVDFLKKNPSQAQAFKDKYGYLPEGFKQ